MKTNEFISNVSRTFNKFGLQCKKHAPEVLVVAGVVGVVTSTVMACKATTKASSIVEESKAQLEDLHHRAEQLENGETLMLTDGSEYTVEDNRKDTAIVYTQTAFKFIKLYGPSILLGTASLACIIASHNILNKRNVALAAAYTAVDKGFKDYRGRVIERFGKELDRELRFNVKQQEIEETTVNDDGTETTVTKTVSVAEPGDDHDEFTRCFDETCAGWTRDAEINLVTIKQVQNWANDRLKSHGYIFLNEVYEALGFNRTKAGQSIGWYYDPSDSRLNNIVDFGIYNIASEEARRFVNGHERSIWLDFNVDGNILNLI